MDFVQAKSILDKFANTYRAAEFMAEALETAVSLERQQMELTNNVEHLQKEQAAQQISLEAMRRAETEGVSAMQGRQAARLAVLQADHDRLSAGLATQRTAVEHELRSARASLDDYTRRANVTMADLDRQLAERREALHAMQEQIEALKAIARQVPA